MATATLILGSKITLIKEVFGGSLVKSGNMSELPTFVKNVNVLSFKGMAKQTKVNKYKKIISDLGFSELSIEWERSAGFDGANSDVIDFNITYSA